MCPFPVYQTQDVSGQTTLLVLVGGEHMARPFYLAPISCMALAVAAAVPGTTEKLTSLTSIALMASHLARGPVQAATHSSVLSGR